jgi:hypothetical protein
MANDAKAEALKAVRRAQTDFEHSQDRHEQVREMRRASGGRFWHGFAVRRPPVWRPG